MIQNYKTIEKLEVDGRDGHKVHRSDFVHMVIQKGLPGLPWFPWRLDHVLGNCGLANIDAKLQ